MPNELIFLILVLLLLRDDFKKVINEIPTQSKILIILVTLAVIFNVKIPEFTLPDM